MISAFALLLSVISRGRENNKSTNLLFFIGCTGVYCFRAANGALGLPFLYNGTELNKGASEARIVYAVLIILCVDIVLNYHKRKNKLDKGKKSTVGIILHSIQNMWLLFMMLCMKPHNISLVTLISLQELCLRHFMKKMCKSFSTTSVTLLFLWMGQAAYFYQVSVFVSSFDFFTLKSL